ncbi:chaplin [Actinoplanes sp. NPDC049118]|uniref:chaplin n=1 Tax=Actinoplanes sp. NPDC049118 TaxID=3155769 RepID=UPI0033F2CF7E
MKTWVRKTLNVGALAAGALLFAPGAAHADVNSQGTGGNVGVLNGTQVIAPVSVPVNIVGNGDSVLGFAQAAGQGANVVESGGVYWGDRVQQVSYGNVGFLNGTQFYTPVNIPVNVVGNSSSFLGIASSAGTGVNRIESGKAGKNRKCESVRGCGGQDVVAQSSAGNFGILNGTQFFTPVSIPINYCGNSHSLLALAASQAQCVNNIESAGVTDKKSAGHSRAAAKTESGVPDVVTQNSAGNFGILNGTQVAAPINIPINICGNSHAVLGLANSTAQCANNIGVRDCTRVNVTVVKNCNRPVNRPRPAVRPDNDQDDDQYAGDNGAVDADKYGDQGRKNGKGESGDLEAIDGLTQSLSNAGGMNIAGLNVMDTLKK